MRSNKPIRIAQVVGKMVGGGVESTVMNYYRHIDRSQIQFDFLVDADSKRVPKQEIQALGGRVFTIPPYQHQGAYQKALSRLFTKEKWLIVHSHINTLSVFPLMAAKRAGVPIRIAHSHATAGGHSEIIRNTAKYMLRPYANIFPTNRFACSQYAGHWLFGKYPFTVIPNAIDLTSYSFNASKRRAFRSHFGINESTLVIGHAGRFAPPKNQENLIKFFAQTHFSGHAILLLAGQGPDLDKCCQLARSLHVDNRVLFVGYQENMQAFYSAIDVFVLPSTYEGFPLALIEAQASGLPCIASTGVPREADTSHVVQFIPYDDTEAWEGALGTVKRRTQRELTHAEQKALEPFNIISAAPRLVGLYRNLISRLNID